MHRFMLFSAMALAGLVAVACAKEDAPPPADSVAAMAPAPAPSPTVSGIELGRKLGANGTVTEAATVFGKRDTMYLSVTTQNAVPTSSLTAKWTFASGQLVDSTTQALARTDATNTATATEFHISKATPWPVGQYKVEVWLDGLPVGSREFSVK